MSIAELPVIIAGPGAIGLGLAVACRSKGRRVAAIGRAGFLPRGCLTVADERIEGEFDPTVSDEAVAVVAVKDYDIEAIIAKLGAEMSKAVAIVTLQNGLGSAERLGMNGRVVRAIVWACARRASPSEANWTGPIRLSVEMQEGKQTVAELVGNYLTSRFTHIELTPPDVFRALQFEKLIVNATANTLAALYDLPCAGLLAHPEALRVAADVSFEIEALARSLCVTLREDPGDIVRRAWTQMGEFAPSMLQDARAGRPLELRSIVEQPLAMAARLGVPMPTLTTLHAALSRQFPLSSSSNL